VIGEEEITNERVDINQSKKEKKENKRSILIDIAGDKSILHTSFFSFRFVDFR